MAVQYQVVLDGIEISEDEQRKLEGEIQDVVRSFLESKQAEVGGDERHELVTDADEVTKRLSDIGGGVFGGGTTMGIIYRPPGGFTFR
jgi:hypothetical protein